MPRPKPKASSRPDPQQRFELGLSELRGHPIFSPLASRAQISRALGNGCPPDSWAVVTATGYVNANAHRAGEPDEWLYVLAHCLLHLGLGHLDMDRTVTREWNAACDCYVSRFLADLKLGRRPEDIDAVDFPVKSEQWLYEDWKLKGLPDELPQAGTGGKTGIDMFRGARGRYTRYAQPADWRDLLGKGLANAVSSAVNVAAGREAYLGANSDPSSPAHRAAQWFMSSYPLLGALAASFTIVQEPEACHGLQVSIAAVDAEAKEIYVNPGAGLDEAECRFVMAHELLHVGLRHQARCLGRDAQLWNVACDFVINGWLIEMGVGELPKRGALYDPELKGLSAEAVYDRIVTDLRRYRKLATLRGVRLGDMICEGDRDWWTTPDGVNLDDFYRRCLSQGIIFHNEQGRGLLPAGLVEEIRALGQPPIPWDVELAKWFDQYFSPIEKVRSFARPNRRQSATPDIPRPSWVPRMHALDGRTFGVILDTSGSMDRKILAKALGAIASYSLSREVPAARVLFCDAVVYDQGYMPPEEIAGKVRVRGRGGTVLQPAVNLLEKAKDFPPDGPVLIITDGMCDRLVVRREHAFLMPAGRNLPFIPKGPVFRIR